MTSSRDEFPARHRLFHAMVLMGGSLALRCGGETAGSPPGNTTGGNATGGSATGGSATGGKASTGGTISGSGGFGAGGKAGSGGSATGGLIITPDPTGGKVSVDPGSFDCPPPQWDCAASPPYCYGNGYRLPEGCKCDRSRPLAPSACAAGQVLVCREGRYTASGAPIETPFGFECSCTAAQLDCGLACDAVFPNSGTCYERDLSGLKEILCNCAQIVLR
jgi:hypothetical protein